MQALPLKESVRCKFLRPERACHGVQRQYMLLHVKAVYQRPGLYVMACKGFESLSLCPLDVSAAECFVSSNPKAVAAEGCLLLL